ncbi:phosphoribosylformylglycinamidine synthase [Symbiobacterium terraclitae]|uniref:Phosphoribosylformylglycinamidine synthase subunit PurS n=1 Tax=Symbiobacterium terraclitae TaxID=557451 RepID=A0ABS4JV79_9FIRM|nr:phosphoribosylformylglycinamidine synthase subunit PurS [Symbiobacterium terraclitae]MBP2019448.1 phosphoribosylformylglycinamidine synthase [Symbiobacterium terraclitae]
MRFQAEVIVSLKKGVLDPQGSAVEGAIKSLGYEGVGQVRFGKHITLVVEAGSREAAEALVADLCKRILSNPVMETFTFTVTEVA